MIRWLAPIAAVLGLLLGMAFPGTVSGGVTGHQLAVAMTPPTLSSGSSPTLTCGWHTACGNPPTAGIALDWDDENSNTGNPWHFRGFFYVSNRARTAFTGYPLDSQSGGAVCDIMTVWIVEKHSGQLMAIPTYMHTNITNNSSFPISGSPWTTYHSRQIGTTINDGGCTWLGSHVHESDVDWLADTTRNTALYPTAQSCSGSCGTFQNNNINNWTRRFEWAEGAASH